MALPGPQNYSNSLLGMCPDLFHPCFTLFHQFGATRSAYGPKRPFWTLWGPSGTPIWPSLNRKTVPIHHWGCALTCSTLVPLCSTSLEPPDPLMAKKGRFWQFWTLFGALWRTHMALPDQRNGFNASPGICPALFHPCSTLFHQFGATRSAYGPKRPFLAVLDPVWGPSGAPI